MLAIWSWFFLSYNANVLFRGAIATKMTSQAILPRNFNETPATKTKTLVAEIGGGGGGFDSHSGPYTFDLPLLHWVKTRNGIIWSLQSIEISLVSPLPLNKIHIASNVLARIILVQLRNLTAKFQR